MADTIRRIEYYAVTVPDEPGSAMQVLEPLERGRVSLVAYLGFPLGDGRSQIDLIPESAGALKAAAATAGLKLSEAKRTFLIQGTDRAGVVAEINRKLAEARVNITASFATCAGGGRYGMVLWVGPADYERAAKALGV